MLTADYYHRRADELRRKAETMTNPESREQVRALVKKYEEVATSEARLRFPREDRPKVRARR